MNYPIPTWSLDPTLSPIPWLSRFRSGGDDTTISAKRGEYVIPDHVVRAKGTEFFDNLVRKHMPMGGTGSPQRGYAMGGVVGEGNQSQNSAFSGISQMSPSFWQGQDAWSEPTPIPVGQGGGATPAPDWGQVTPSGYGGNYPASWDVGQPSVWSAGYGGYVPAYGGIPAQGQGTMIPTDWVNYPGVGWVPMAVPSWRDAGMAGNFGQGSWGSIGSGFGAATNIGVGGGGGSGPGMQIPRAL